MVIFLFFEKEVSGPYSVGPESCETKNMKNPKVAFRFLFVLFDLGVCLKFKFKFLCGIGLTQFSKSGVVVDTNSLCCFSQVRFRFIFLNSNTWFDFTRQIAVILASLLSELFNLGER